MEYKDKNYAKKHKELCKYCSYRQAVPSKNNQYCSEICRLLHISICSDLHKILDKPFNYKQKILNKEIGVFKLEFD